MELEIRDEQRETRSEQLNQKITPDTRRKLDELLKKMGFPAEKDGHVKWDQEKLLEMIQNIESHIVMDDHECYSEVVTAINQYTTLINSKLISLISDLDTTEARIRSEYEAKIASRDSIIKDLQEQKSVQESEKKSAMEDASKSKDAQTIAEKYRMDAEENLKKAESTVKDKESIIQMLTSKLKEAEEKLSGYDALRASEASLKEQVSMVLHQKEMAEAKAGYEEEQHTEAQSTCEKLEEQLEKISQERSDLHDQVKSLQRDLEEQKRNTDQKIEELKNTSEQSKELAIERAIKKAQDEMRQQMVDEQKTLHDQIAALRDEKTRLEVQLEMTHHNAKSENASK